VEKDFDEIHFFGDKTYPVRGPARPPARLPSCSCAAGSLQARTPPSPAPAAPQPPHDAPPAAPPAARLQGGNDYEIFSSEKTIGHTVTSPDDTRKQCTELFLQ
jgi:hypothetical protein